jgi:anti-sigma regulatory factor (Ser/Thr protein kinase)
MRRIRYSAIAAALWSAVSRAGVWWLLMARDASRARRPQAPEEPAFPLAPTPGRGSSLSPPVHGVMAFVYTTDLSAVRALVHRHALRAGLSESRAIDLMLAVSEVAANTVRHAKSAGCLDIWYDAKEIVCQIRDRGIIADPLAGRRKPALDALGGHGLWIVNQVCDEFEMRSDETGTTFRLHMTLAR